jgi:hypothetical protein
MKMVRHQTIRDERERICGQGPKKSSFVSCWFQILSQPKKEEPIIVGITENIPLFVATIIDMVMPALKRVLVIAIQHAMHISQYSKIVKGHPSHVKNQPRGLFPGPADAADYYTSSSSRHSQEHSRERRCLPRRNRTTGNPSSSIRVIIPSVPFSMPRVPSDTPEVPSLNSEVLIHSFARTDTPSCSCSCVKCTARISNTSCLLIIPQNTQKRKSPGWGSYFAEILSIFTFVKSWRWPFFL